MATNVKPTPYAYISLDDMKEWLKIDSSITKSDSMVQRFINTACARVEKYIDGPVITREFAETRDGNASNVIVPEYYPIRSIEQIRIDFNRNFTDVTELDQINYVLRGKADMEQFVHTPSNPWLEIRGTDIVLRDDNNTAILGRIFSGSIVQSIELKYTAGWGKTPEELPQELVQATMMLAEYLYTIWDQKLLGVKSRTSMQQGYSRDTSTGIPREITDLLDQFKDYGFGMSNVPQRNIFQI